MVFESDIRTSFFKLVNTASIKQGVFDGNTGLAILAGILYKETTDDLFNDVFQNCIHEISENIISVKETNFENGIAGIGWGIEWISQNKFLNVNTDDVLEEFDDLLYKTIVFTKSHQFNILKGELGLLNYFHFRNNSKNIGTHRFKKLVNRECVTILEDRINDYLKNITITDFQLTNNDLIALGDILKTISPLYNVLNTEKDSVLQNSLKITEAFLSTYIKKELPSSSFDTNKSLCVLYLASNFLYAGKNVSSNHYLRSAKKNVLELLADINRYKSNFATQEMISLLRSYILLCLYDNNNKNLAGLGNVLDYLKDKLNSDFALNDCKDYIIGRMVFDGRILQFKAQELIFYPQ